MEKLKVVHSVFVLQIKAIKFVSSNAGLFNHGWTQQSNDRLYYWLQSCLNQDFDDSGISVAKNLYFAEEYTYNIKLMFTRLDARLGKWLFRSAGS